MNQANVYVLVDFMNVSDLHALLILFSFTSLLPIVEICQGIKLVVRDVGRLSYYFHFRLHISIQRSELCHYFWSTSVIECKVKLYVIIELQLIFPS